MISTSMQSRYGYGTIYLAQNTWRRHRLVGCGGFEVPANCFWTLSCGGIISDRHYLSLEPELTTEIAERDGPKLNPEEYSETNWMVGSHRVCICKVTATMRGPSPRGLRGPITSFTSLGSWINELVSIGVRIK